MFRRTFLVTAAALALASAAPFAQRVSYDRDPATDLARYRTYGYAPGQSIADGLMEQRIVLSLDRELAAKGLRPAAGFPPDAIVVYRVRLDDSLQVVAMGMGPGPVGGRMGSARADRVLVATLIVEVLDASTRRVVWRGTATTDVDQYASPERRDRQVAKAVAKLLKPYPVVR